MQPTEAPSPSELAAELNPLNDITGTKLDFWTGAEQSMFNAFVKTFPGNFCAIAQCMITKKCRQVKLAIERVCQLGDV